MSYVKPLEANGNMAGKIVHVSGKRKTAVARVTIKEGNGMIRINTIPLEIYGDEMYRKRIEEILMIASDHIDLNKLNISINVKGGGFSGQIDAIRNALAKGLVEYSENDKLLEAFLNYDRVVIAGDHRLTEPHKPSQSSKGPRHKRQKSYR